MRKRSNTMNNTSKLTEFLRDAISDYAAHTEEKAPAEWLQDYLCEKLPDKSADAIQAISGEILDTLDIMEQKKAALNEALENGQSAENWLTTDVIEQNGGNGSKAHLALELLNGASLAKASYGDAIEAEIIDAEDIDWSDGQWNDYKLKDTLKGTAIEAGSAALREIASDVFQKASEEGLSQALSDGEFIAETLTHGACEGLKVAVSAGLSIAKENGALPHATFQILATTAHKTVESFSAFRDVVKGKSTVLEAVIKIKNTAVSTFCGMVDQYKDCIKSEMIDAAGFTYGVKGAAIAGAVFGLITPPQECSRLKNALIEAGKAVWSFLTKERQLPFFNKNKNKQISYNEN